MKTKMKKFPKTPFKLDCGDKPEVRQWLHDNGCVWGDGESLITEELDAKFLLVYSTLDVCFSRDIIIPETGNFALFNPFKKRSKLEKRKLEERIEALEEQIKSSGLLMKNAWDLSSLPSFRCKTATIKEETEYLYEVLEKSFGQWYLGGKLFKECDIPSGVSKTGRKFIEKDGSLLEVKESIQHIKRM